MEENKDKKLTMEDALKTVDLSKLDLSEENMKRTIDYSKEHVLLKDLKPMYEDLELIIQHSDNFLDCEFQVGNINNLSEELGNMRVLSVHVYHDTSTTSVIVGKDN